MDSGFRFLVSEFRFPVPDSGFQFPGFRVALFLSNYQATDRPGIPSDRSMRSDFSNFPCASVLKQVLVRNLSCENEFDMHENEPVCSIFSEKWFRS